MPREKDKYRSFRCAPEWKLSLPRWKQDLYDLFNGGLSANVDRMLRETGPKNRNWRQMLEKMMLDTGNMEAGAGNGSSADAIDDEMRRLAEGRMKAKKAESPGEPVHRVLARRNKV